MQVTGKKKDVGSVYGLCIPASTLKVNIVYMVYF